MSELTLASFFEPSLRLAGRSQKPGRAFRVAAVSVLIACAVIPEAVEAAFPDRPVTIIVPYPAGGASDALARSVGQKMSAAFGQPVVVENRTGASGQIGLAAAARATPDGYTIVFACTTDSAIIESASKVPPAVNVRDHLTPVAGVALAPHILVVPKNLAPSSTGELINYLKSRPGKDNFASIGIGTLSHLEGELLMLTTGVEITHIPYRGGAQALTELIAGNSSLMFLSAPAAVPHIKAGTVRVLAVVSDKRLPLLPEAPTIAEGGVQNFSAENLFGFYAPKDTPAALVNTLSAAVQTALRDDGVKAYLDSQGLEIQYTDPQAYKQRTIDTFRTYQTLVRNAKVTLD